MAEKLNNKGSETSVTVLDEPGRSQQDVPPSIPAVRLKLKKPKSQKSVKWGEDTVDNENMNKKKSKCCCIYKKPKQNFDDSSSEESDDCENCFGHVELKKLQKQTAN
ncbi:unnamed protein product [Bemisia tabaci]|uniref:E3 ubiquitin-protein ligase PPP1R11 n=1 Tax=Bemisia tabaci TaxID=7038 RepID=A0A9P0AC77_BEMTA|nr:PREDICTED: protein phosphatase 1 regulatory subunit 11-like [Bemisia tabaci]CAH0390048.1 unnamed protein product [Bemisia tabaci]